jgi:ADP-heptose:LPS heptosyltransferase
MIDWRNHPILAADLPPKRIAVLRALQLGDLLLAVPALRSLRSGFPGAEITLIGLPWAASFAQRFAQYIDRFLTFPGYEGIAEAPFDTERTAEFMREQRAYGYDLAIQMHGNGCVSNQFALDLHARMTAGYFPRTLDPRLTLGLPYPNFGAEIRRNLGLCKLLGCPNQSTRLEFPLNSQDESEADLLLETCQGGRTPLVVIHAGARSPARRWPAANFAEVADNLARENGADVVLTGGPGEEDTVNLVESQMATRPLNLAGLTSLGGLAAIIARADLLISNDTGPAHLADALKTPSVTIFGPADHKRWAALDRSLHYVVRWPVGCNPCGNWECPIDHRCLRLISPDLILEVARHALLKGGLACNA